MSILRVNTLQDASGSGQPTMPGAAKAWVNFNGTGTVAIRAAFNVTSITDNGSVGDYTVNFTTALADASYSANIAAAVNATTAGVCSPMGAAPTSSAFRMRTYGATFVATDCEFISATFHR